MTHSTHKRDRKRDKLKEELNTWWWHRSDERIHREKGARRWAERISRAARAAQEPCLEAPSDTMGT